jgi:hypothetical protein
MVGAKSLPPTEAIQEAITECEEKEAFAFSSEFLAAIRRLDYSVS